MISNPVIGLRAEYNYCGIAWLGKPEIKVGKVILSDKCANGNLYGS